MSLLHNPSVFANEFLDSYPLEYQEKILHCQKRFIVVRCGRQIGKTWTICVKAINYAFTHANKNILVIAPSQRQSTRMFRIIKNYIYRSKILKRSIDPTQPQTQTEINLTNGVVIKCLPAVSETIRGEAGDLIIIDEAAFIESGVFHEVVLPMIASTRGQLWLISTPKGRRGFFYQASVMAQTNKYGWTEFYFPSILGTKFIRRDTGLPQIDPEYLEQQKETLDNMIFRQEYLAEFIEAADNYLSSMRIDEMHRPIIQVNSALPGREYFISADLAKKIDRFVLIIVERREENNRQIAEVVKVIVKKGIDYHDQIAIIDEAVKLFNPEMTWVDQTGVGEMPVEALKMMDYSTRVEGVIMSLQKKQKIYSNFKRATESNSILFPNIKEMIDELKELRYEYTIGGLNIKIFGEKYDDYCDALAMVSQCLSAPIIKANIQSSTKGSVQVPLITYVSRRGINISTGSKGVLKTLKKLRHNGR